MKNIGINNPCSENWNEMTANEKGAFCQKCASQVYDFTRKSSLEIKQTLRSLIGQPVCGRITQSQEDVLNAEFEAWMNSQKQYSFQNLVFFSLLVVFGLTLFSCENEQDKKNIKNIQTAVMRVIHEDKEQSEPVQEIIAEEKIELIKIVQKEELYPMMGQMMIKQQDHIYKQKEEYGVHIKSDIERVHGGAMISTSYYERYLIEQVNIQPEIIELDANGEALPTSFKAIAFPNPAREQTTIELAIPYKNNFEINLFDLSGKLIAPVHSGEIERGKFRQQLDLIDLPPGVYLVVINSANFRETVKFVKS